MQAVEEGVAYGGIAAGERVPFVGGHGFKRIEYPEAVAQGGAVRGDL